ncbi:uncharacterized protein MAM_01049 [Metarhizium album ARSEF 1941]|uniref:Myb-like DNA-binding domain-containing protein n=1 Tax=Metarhizium album (strain ARSEF 1941) TaxID=1081103 RepID=A0A0B2X8D8_METAS|nr:uncharacterized protein MAM_01049 [Metarhizium album ARSEF 1941]KHO02048.1 hypothetical protein MAM_01049 [Metarhizium album ARSEF 1941]
MPGTQDPAEQVKFLVSCIGHTNNGRPDFAAVADELGIVTKAAAQKRYERMLKANGVTATKSPPKAADDGAMPTPQSTPVKRKAAAPRIPGSAKKTKGKAGEEVKKESSGDEDTKEGVKKDEDSESELSDPPPSEDAEC